MWTIIAFAERHDRHLVKHYIIPGLGLITNVLMLIAILYLYIIGNADSQDEAYHLLRHRGWMGSDQRALRGPPEQPNGQAHHRPARRVT